MDEKSKVLIDQMTLEEKVSLLAGADLWHTVPTPRLGIPVLKVTDGPAGARGVDDPTSPTSACFPCGTALAATWNPELVERVGQALAAETRAKGAHILLAPTVNIHRSPLAGRNFECYSEDPYLTGRMAVAYIRGLQNGGVGACIKHFVCNDSEFERQSISSEVGERALREIYLRPFEMAVREAKPWAVMSSYNRVNGIYSSENAHLLLDILKGEWGFNGIVMSDWFGTYSPRVAQGGLDLEMPGPARFMGQRALEAAERGELSQVALDDKVRRILETYARAGLFEHPEPCPEQAIDRPEHRQLAREAAGQAIVLLKNTPALLPLDPGKIRSIAIIGENARWTSFIGGGSTRVTPHYVISPLDAIQKRAGPSVRVGYAFGCSVHKNLPLLDQHWLADKLTLEYFSNRKLEGAPVRTDATSKTELVWFGDVSPAVDPDNFSARLSGAFSVPESGTYELSLTSIGESRLYVDDKLLIDRWDSNGLSRTGRAEIDLAAGQTHTLRIEYAGEPGQRWRTLRVGCAPKIPSDSIQQAVNLATQSDVAIVFAGLTHEWESEGYDRPDMELPGDQAKLIEEVAAANPNTVVVLNVGSPIRMDWLDRVAAVVQAWYLGQETGNAIADVLFGDVNPSGRLPTTFPKRLQDNPAYLNYPGENGKVLYGEGLYVGYRYYDTKHIAPRFPFGYGLSYTTFAYRNLSLAPPDPDTGGVARVSVDVENTGGRAGQETVQVYIRDVQSRLARPEKELKAFAKVALEPGETKTVTMALGEEALPYYDPASGGWVAEPGEFEVLVGSSAADIHLRAAFTFSAGQSDKPQQRPRLHVGLPLKTLLDNPAAKGVLAGYLSGYISDAQIEMVWDMSLEQLATYVPDLLTPELLKQINDQLARV